MHKEKMKLSVFLLYIQSCIFSACDLCGPSLALVSCHSIWQDVNPLGFFPEEFFRLHIFRIAIRLLIFCLFSIPVGLQSSSPSFPVLQLWGDSPSCVVAYLPWPNCWWGTGATCLFRLTCFLLNNISSGANKERECMAWSCLLAISYVSSPSKKHYIPF